MSLLMDALKKAEEAKRLASERNTPENPAAKQELRLEPVIPPAAQATTPAQNLPRSQPGSPLPDLSMHIDSVDADLAAVSTEAPVKRRATTSHTSPPARSSDTSNRQAAERMAVRNVFAAKQPTKTRAGLWLMLGLGGIAILGVGAYFWWQLQAVSVGSLARSAPPVPPAQQTLQPLPPAAPAQAHAPVAEVSNPLPEAATQPLFAPPPAAPEPSPAFERTARAPRAPATGNQGAPESPVRLSRSQPKTNQILERAYDALQAGNMGEAQRDYEQALRSDAKNTDALLGLATIAARQGQTEQAQTLYLRALESDPNDATAQAGLLNTKGQADPGLSESRLKTVLASQPGSPALHFALGNLYARQQRWSEAQQAYFRAYSIEPDNADFIFNLAVSLDQLHQKKLAAQYYQMALNASATNNNLRAIAFDRNQVKTRVLELQP